MKAYAIMNEKGKFYNNYGGLIEWFDSVQDAMCSKSLDYMKNEIEFTGIQNCKIISVEIRREYEAIKG